MGNIRFAVHISGVALVVVIKLAIVIVVLHFYNSFYCILDGRAIALAVTIDAPIKKLDWADVIGPVRGNVMVLVTA